MEEVRFIVDESHFRRDVQCDFRNSFHFLGINFNANNILPTGFLCHTPESDYVALVFCNIQRVHELHMRSGGGGGDDACAPRNLNSGNICIASKCVISCHVKLHS